MLDLLRSYGFPPPAINVVLDGLPRRVEVDFLYADARLIIEADGARYHENRLAREADVTRQAMLEAAGYRVMRLNWAQVTQAPDQTASRLRRALARSTAASGSDARSRAPDVGLSRRSAGGEEVEE